MFQVFVSVDVVEVKFVYVYECQWVVENFLNVDVLDLEKEDVNESILEQFFKE